MRDPSTISTLHIYILLAMGPLYYRVSLFFKEFVAVGFNHRYYLLLSFYIYVYIYSYVYIYICWITTTFDAIAPLSPRPLKWVLLKSMYTNMCENIHLPSMYMQIFILNYRFAQEHCSWLSLSHRTATSFVSLEEILMAYWDCKINVRYR